MSGFFKGGENLNPGERHSRVTRDDGTVTLRRYCTLRNATVLSPNCCADFGRSLQQKRSCRIRVTVRVAQRHCQQTLYLSLGCGIPRLPLLKGNCKGQATRDKRSQVRSFSQIFADFCRFSLFLGSAAFGRRRSSQKTADFRRKPQETADFRRNPFVPFSLCLLIPP